LDKSSFNYAGNYLLIFGLALSNFSKCGIIFTFLLGKFNILFVLSVPVISYSISKTEKTEIRGNSWITPIQELGQ